MSKKKKREKRKKKNDREKTRSVSLKVEGKKRGETQLSGKQAKQEGYCKKDLREGGLFNRKSKEKKNECKRGARTLLKKRG